MMILKLEVGDIIRLKKNHPCGSDTFEVLRVGSDVRIRCRSCGHDVSVPRVKLEKNIKMINDERILR